MKYDIRTMLGTGLMVAGLASSAVAFAPAEEPAAAVVESESPVRLEVDLSERVLYVYDSTGLMNTFEVAVGEPEHPTPEGNFEIDRVVWNPAWVPPNVEWAEDKEKKEPEDPDNPMQGAKIFFEYPDYYIHGTDAPHTLGEAESHGCIRMRPVDVKALAKFVQKAGGEDRSESWFERVKRDDSTKHEVTLPDPIPIEVRA